jgi:hypothetical protein
VITFMPTPQKNRDHSNQMLEQYTASGYYLCIATRMTHAKPLPDFSFYLLFVHCLLSNKPHCPTFL